MVKQLEVPTERGWHEQLGNNRAYVDHQPLPNGNAAMEVVMDQEVNNDSDRSALMYYTIAHDKSELPGNRRSAKQMYEHKYGSIDEPFGWNPRFTFGGFSSGVVQPIVGNTLKGWGWVIGWLIGHGG